MQCRRSPPPCSCSPACSTNAPAVRAACFAVDARCAPPYRPEKERSHASHHQHNTTVPTWLKWIEDVSLVNYAFDALLAQQESILPGQQVRTTTAYLVYVWRESQLGFFLLCFISPPFPPRPTNRPNPHHTHIHLHIQNPQPEFLRKFIEYDPKSMGKNIGLLWALAAGLQFLTYVNVVLRLRATKVVN